MPPDAVHRLSAELTDDGFGAMSSVSSGRQPFKNQPLEAFNRAWHAVCTVVRSDPKGVPMFKSCIFACAFALSTTVASAAMISPVFDSFGSLPTATFGGSGIPNHAVAIASSGGDLTLGLTAHQRFVGPNLANDGNGTFTAFKGTSGPGLSTWNFGFYISGADISDQRFRLDYDLNAAVGNDESTHGSITFAGAGLGTLIQDSQNPGFGFLALGGSFGAFTITAPGGSFDPNALGEYTFRLTALDGTSDNVVAQVAIRVNVVDPNAVPEPLSLALVGTALAGLGLARRRRL